MKRNILFFLIIILPCIISPKIFSKTIPCDEHGRIGAGMITDGQSDTWGNFMANRESEYVQRFGAFPRVMIWDDLDQYKNILWQVYFTRSSNLLYDRGIPEPSWENNLTWDDIRSYLHWKIESIKSGEIRYFDVKQGNGKDLVSDTTSFGSWRYRFNFDADEWEVPNDESAWNLSLVFYEGEPGNSKLILESKSYPVVRSIERHR